MALNYTDKSMAVGALAALLEQRQWMMVTAESCTGGMIASACTDRAGSSVWFAGGIVSYSNHLKQSLLKVPTETLKCHGAVSEETAAAMASGALACSRAQVSVATTGIAGPAGAVAGKPVGTVCFGYAIAGQRYTETQYLAGSRTQVREAAMLHALNKLISYLQVAD